MSHPIPQIAFLGPIGSPELIFILVILLILFGGKKIPQLARGLGESVLQFRKGRNEVREPTIAEKKSGNA